jgi:hypothetical protein
MSIKFSFFNFYEIKIILFLKVQGRRKQVALLEELKIGSKESENQRKILRG